MSTGFIDPSIEGLSKQEINFCAKIGGYTLDKVKPADIVLVKADSAYMVWLIGAKKAYISNGESWTTYVDTLIHGVDGGVSGVQPALPTVGTAPASVHEGIRTRFSNISADCKSSTGYTEAIGIDLGIVQINTPFVPSDGKPVVKESLHVGHPFFKYPKGDYDGVQIYKDSSDGHGFVKFDKAINPTYTDNTGLPEAGVAVVWKYRFVYLYKGEEVGTASLVIEVVVTGM
ncbi:MAG: hypothetical protein WCN27_03325 [Alphaproteobacteria bacterium]